MEKLLLLFIIFINVITHYFYVRLYFLCSDLKRNYLATSGKATLVSDIPTKILKKQ